MPDPSQFRTAIIAAAFGAMLTGGMSYVSIIGSNDRALGVLTERVGNVKDSVDALTVAMRPLPGMEQKLDDFGRRLYTLEHPRGDAGAGGNEPGEGMVGRRGR